MKILSRLNKIVKRFLSENQKAAPSMDSKESVPSPYYIIQNDQTKDRFRASRIAFRFPVEVYGQIKRLVKISYLDDPETVKKTLNYDAIRKAQENKEIDYNIYKELVGSFSIMKVSKGGLLVNIAKLKILITTDLDIESQAITGCFESQIFNISSPDGYSWSRTLKYSEDYAESISQKFF